MVEYFDHTADIGMRIIAASLPELFGEAGKGLFRLIVENYDSLEFSSTNGELHLQSGPLDLLLFDWLRELLYRFDQRHEVLGNFLIEVAVDGGLTARFDSVPLDPQRHVLDHEVKAITYHELAVRPTPQGWEALVILDI
jgi:SHS2 domain-containing protein